MHSQMCNMHQLHSQLGKVRLSAPRQAVARQAPVQRQKHFTVYARRPEAGIGMFGTKAGMTQIFTPEGLAISATVIALEEGNIVTQVHTVDTRGYNAVQVGYQVVPERKLTKPEAGHCKKAGVKPMRHLREFKVCKSILFKSCTIPFLLFSSISASHACSQAPACIYSVILWSLYFRLSIVDSNKITRG